MKSKLLSMTKILFLTTMILLTLITIGLADDFPGHIEDHVTRVYDQQDNYIFSIAMGVKDGDRYISGDNIEYVIKRVDGDKAVASRIGEVDLLAGVKMKANTIPPLATVGKKLVGIYHTHNDESYKPGPISKYGNGEVLDVGAVLTKALNDKGIRVIHSDNLHLPHDGAAYERSRATALDIAKSRPDAILDIHRDAIPEESEYLKTVNGKKISQIRLVVGRQNPNRKNNDSFARQLKAIADKQYSGLIRDIFYGSGTYNQQINSRALLFEFGTHVTGKERAQASATMLSDSINQLLYGGKGNQSGQGTRAAENRNSLSTIAWIIGILVVGMVIYLYINEGSWEGVINRIRNFFSREIT